MSYKQTIKAQIKKAVRRFNRNKFNASRTRTIEHRPPKKKYMRRSFNYYQRLIKDCSPDACHVLNFYNILAINETAIRNPAHDESFVKSHFYYKNMKRVEATDNYFVVFLEDNPSLVCPVAEFIARYKRDPDPRFHRMGALLEDIERRLEMQRPASEERSSLEREAEEVLAGLGSSAFICKIGSDRLVISKSMMDLFGYDTEQFIIECIKFRVPCFEGFACDSYYEAVMKNLENVLLLMDLLAGRIPLETFRELAYFEFSERVLSKRNREYRCRMSLSMPMPLIALIKVEEVLEAREQLGFEGAMGGYKGFKAFVKEVREKEFATLQHLIPLPTNSLPHNKPKVANYLPLSDDENPKSSITFPLSPSPPHDHSLSL